MTSTLRATVLLGASLSLLFVAACSSSFGSGSPPPQKTVIVQPANP